MQERPPHPLPAPRPALGLPVLTHHPVEAAAVVGWLVRLRWLAIAAQTGAGVLGFHYVFLDARFALPFALTVAALFLFNCQWALRLRSDETVGKAQVAWHLSVDAVAFFTLLAFSGGTRNPFLPLVFIHVALGALLLDGARRLLFFGLVLLALPPLFLARHLQVLSSDIHVLEASPLVALATALVVTGVLVGWLSDTLTATRQSLDRARSRESRIHHLLALGALTAEFAHQFATPLNTLKMRLARLVRRMPSGDSADDVAAIGSAVERAEKLLREMTVAPLDSSMLAFEVLTMDRFVEEAIGEWRERNPGVEVAVTSRLRGDRCCRVPARIFRRAVGNLLDNASAASDGPGIELEVWDSPTHVHIAVMDRGPGWPSEMKHGGITPFFSTRPGGTGLGLFNCQSLAEVLGGTLELLDRKGGGAIAKLSVPKLA